MTRSRMLIVCILVAAFLPIAFPVLADGAEPGRAATANNAFALDLFKTLSQANTGKNVFLSPYSLSAALSMTYAGAREQTADEMAKTLGFNPPGESVHGDFKALTRKVLKSCQTGCRLNVANALWGQDKKGFKKDFLDLVEKNYQGGFKEVDFVGQTEQSRQTINQWIQKNTEDRIKDLLAPGDVGPDTDLVLTNAIYFKGDWASKFDPQRTRTMPFHITPEKSVDVDMMFQKGSFLYGEPMEGLKVLELPYHGEEVSMVILLPQNGVKTLIQDLTPATLGQWVSDLEKSEVDVYLPKFRFQSRYSLQSALQSLGMRQAFGGGADFSGMTGGKGLFISKVIHQADIDVHEEGTVAAAATAVIMGKSVSLSETFKADHPFIFLIRHRPTNAILFMGGLMEPAGVERK